MIVPRVALVLASALGGPGWGGTISGALKWSWWGRKLSSLGALSHSTGECYWLFVGLYQWSTPRNGQWGLTHQGYEAITKWDDPPSNPQKGGGYFKTLFCRSWNWMKGTFTRTPFIICQTWKTMVSWCFLWIFPESNLMSRGCTTSQMVFAFWRETFSSTGRILQMALAQQMFGNIKSP